MVLTRVSTSEKHVNIKNKFYEMVSKLGEVIEYELKEKIEVDSACPWEEDLEEDRINVVLFRYFF